MIVLYMEKNFRTPEGNFTNAKWVERSSLIILAEVPELMAYWTPRPGHNSTLDSFLNLGAAKMREIDANLFNLEAIERRDLNEKKEKARVVSNAGKYELDPEGKTTNESSLLEKGTNCRVETIPGITERNLVLSRNNRIRRKVLPLDLITTLPVKLERPAFHFLRKDNGLNFRFVSQSDLKVLIFRDALEVTDFLLKIKITLITVAV